MIVAKVTEGRNKKQYYYYMNNDRIVSENTSRSATFRVSDIVELEGGALGAQFLINQNGKRIKVKEINSSVTLGKINLSNLFENHNAYQFSVRCLLAKYFRKRIVS